MKNYELYSVGHVLLLPISFDPVIVSYRYVTISD